MIGSVRVGTCVEPPSLPRTRSIISIHPHRRLAAAALASFLLAGCDDVGEGPAPTHPPEVVVSTELAPRLEVAKRRGAITREGDTLSFPASAGLDLYVPVSPSSQLVARVESGSVRVELRDEEGRTLDATWSAGPARLDLGGVAGGLVRVRLEAGADGARIAGLGIGATPQPREGARIARAQYDVLVILLDSLRADELDQPSIATPTLDALGRAGVVFTAARAPASWTRPSVASLLSAVAPSTHRISLLTEKLPDDVPLLPELLAGAGYYTAGLLHSSQLAPRFGFRRGFERLELFYQRDAFRAYQALTTPEARADWVFERGLAPVLEAAGSRPWFVYLHEMDPHDPYEPPAPFDTLYTEDDDPKSKPTGPAHYVSKDVDEADLARLRGLYRGEITFMDAFLASLLGRLGDAQPDRKRLVVFVSDHGEAFGEHGELGHARVVAEHQLRVPLILELPGVLPSGRRIDAPVDLVDVAPTVLDLVGATPDPRMEGRSLLPLIEAPERTASGPRVFFAESITRAEATVRVGRWKLVRRVDDPRNAGRGFVELADVEAAGSTVETALYDLATDPGEATDVATARPFVTQALTQLLAWQDHRGQVVSRADAAAPVGIDADVRDHLEALGYIDEDEPALDAGRDGRAPATR